MIIAKKRGVVVVGMSISSYTEKQNNSPLDKRVLDYIKKELKKGFSKEIIRQVLIKVGHNQEYIELHFKYLQKQTTRKILTAIITFLLIAIVFSFIFYFQVNRDIAKKYNMLVAEGDVLCQKEKYEKAMQKFDKAIELNSTMQIAYARKGWCFFNQGKYNETIREIKKAEYLLRTYNPNFRVNPNIPYVIGAAYCQTGDLENGLMYLRIAVRMNSSESKFYRSLEDCNIKLAEKQVK